jgi:tetratricopeptide (TPR) repeat protein
MTFEPNVMKKINQNLIIDDINHTISSETDNLAARELINEALSLGDGELKDELLKLAIPLLSTADESIVLEKLGNLNDFYLDEIIAISLARIGTEKSIPLLEKLSASHPQVKKPALEAIEKINSKKESIKVLDNKIGFRILSTPDVLKCLSVIKRYFDAISLSNIKKSIELKEVIVDINYYDKEGASALHKCAEECFAKGAEIEILESSHGAWRSIRKLPENNNTEKTKTETREWEELVRSGFDLVYNDNQKALEIFNKALEIPDCGNRALLGKAVALEQMNFHVKAIDEYSKYLKNDPFDKIAWNNIGLCYGYLNKTGKAEQAFEKALEIDSTYTKSMINLAGICKNRGDIKKSLSIVLKAIDIETNGVNYYNAACYLALLGKEAEALINLQKAISEFSDEEDWQCIAQNDPDFDSIRNRAEFIKLIKGDKKLIMKEEIASLLSSNSFEDYLKGIELFENNIGTKNLSDLDVDQDIMERVCAIFILDKWIEYQDFKTIIESFIQELPSYSKYLNNKKIGYNLRGLVIFINELAQRKIDLSGFDYVRSLTAAETISTYLSSKRDTKGQVLFTNIASFFHKIVSAQYGIHSSIMKIEKWNKSMSEGFYNILTESTFDKQDWMLGSLYKSIDDPVVKTDIFNKYISVLENLIKKYEKENSPELQESVNQMLEIVITRSKGE